VDDVSERVGMVLGTEDATPLIFWVAVAPEAYLQLDDAVIVDTDVPGRGPLRISGIVQDARARHEGASFDTDVFLVDRGVLPVDTAVAAQVVATRFEPEIFVPPMPGLPAFRARGKDRDEALYFDQMARKIPAGLSRDGEPVYLDLDFLDGSRGAHVNVSGVSRHSCGRSRAACGYLQTHASAIIAYVARQTSIDAVMEALGRIKYPGYSSDILALGIIEEAAPLPDSGFALTLRQATEREEVMKRLAADIHQALSHELGIAKLELRVRRVEPELGEKTGRVRPGGKSY